MQLCVKVGNSLEDTEVARVVVVVVASNGLPVLLLVLHRVSSDIR